MYSKKERKKLSNQHIRPISEGSCEVIAWWTFCFAITWINYILKYRNCYFKLKYYFHNIIFLLYFSNKCIQNVFFLKNCKTQAVEWGKTHCLETNFFKVELLLTMVKHVHLVCLHKTNNGNVEQWNGKMQSVWMVCIKNTNKIPSDPKPLNNSIHSISIISVAWKEQIQKSLAFSK